MEAVAIGKAAPGTDLDMFCDTPENSRTFGYGFLMWSMVVFLVCLTLDTIHESSSLPYIDKRNLHLAPTVDVLFFIDTKVVRRITCIVRVAARDFQLDWKSTQKLDQQTMNSVSGTTRNARRLFSVSGFLFNAVDLKIENPPGDITVIFVEGFGWTESFLFLVHVFVLVVAALFTYSASRSCVKPVSAQKSPSFQRTRI